MEILLLLPPRCWDYRYTPTKLYPLWCIYCCCLTIPGIEARAWHTCQGERCSTELPFSFMVSVCLWYLKSLGPQASNTLTLAKLVSLSALGVLHWERKKRNKDVSRCRGSPLTVLGLPFSTRKAELTTPIPHLAVQFCCCCFSSS